MSDMKSSSADEIESILAKTDITGVKSVYFSLNNGEGFRVTSEKVIKLSRYIADSLGKTKFEPNELSTAFKFLVKNIKSNFDPEERKTLTNSIEEFIENGGEIRFEYKEFLEFSAIEQPNQSHEGREKNEDAHSNDRITFKRLLLSVLILHPISGAVGYTLFLLIVFLSDSISPEIGRNCIFACPILAIWGIITIALGYFFWKQVLGMSTKKLILIYFLSLLIIFSVALVICGGLLLILS
ncbi:MAG: hypothetical protein HHAS10_03890 [Candidatus Altimarinota bacterium]